MLRVMLCSRLRYFGPDDFTGCVEFVLGACNYVNSSMERAYVVVYALSCCPQVAIIQKDALSKHSKVAYLGR